MENVVYDPRKISEYIEEMKTYANDLAGRETDRIAIPAMAILSQADVLAEALSNVSIEGSNGANALPPCVGSTLLTAYQEAAYRVFANEQNTEMDRLDAISGFTAHCFEHFERVHRTDAQPA